MRIIQINTFPHKATGNIMLNLHNILLSEGFDSYVCWGRGRKAESNWEIVIEDNLGMKIHGVYTRVLDKTGFASKAATRKLLKKLDEIEPDIIHLHNIHGYYLNIELLFNYIRNKQIKVIWTLHDCWALTGHCAWFDMCGCNKWINGCNHCEQLNTYPVSIFRDNSKWNWQKKKELFTNLDITIVTPCNWLAKLVEKSYLKEYPIKVIYNGIDLEVFQPSKSKGIFEKYSLEPKKIVLGVASEWTPRKGLHDFIELSRRMEDVQFVVVGLEERELKKIPDSIIGIKRTNSAKKLAELYSVADLFFNPTYEDNFPTTNLEALACGTPVVTYDTGGSGEAIIEGQKATSNAVIGKIIKKNSQSSVDYLMVEKILREMLLVKKDEISDDCRHAALLFDKHMRLREYLSLYCQ